MSEVIRGLARERGVPVEVRLRADLDRLVKGVPHQGVVAEAGPFPYVEPEDILTRAVGAREAAFLVVLDGIQDPQNLGAILRTAEAAGAHGLILPRDRAVGVTPGAVRASAGRHGTSPGGASHQPGSIPGVDQGARPVGRGRRPHG